jgi:lipopolysaccharide/colanic/teichoic acid biosynthesis glycosyltransferase
MRRAFDLLAAALGLLLASPLLLVALLAIRLESRGSPIYRQGRVGLNGKPFSMVKLRTMRQGADPVGIGTAVTRDDPRVTRVGRVLRRFAFDEVPNLVNVLRGEMSIVGPRPTIASQVELYTPRQRRRLEVRPGCTGWAQVQGRAEIPWEERIELDVWYVDHRSAALDARIIARTIAVLLRGTGTTATGGADAESPASWGRRAEAERTASKDD